MLVVRLGPQSASPQTAAACPHCCARRDLADSCWLTSELPAGATSALQSLRCLVTRNTRSPADGSLARRLHRVLCRSGSGCCPPLGDATLMTSGVSAIMSAADHMMHAQCGRTARLLSWLLAAQQNGLLKAPAAWRVPAEPAGAQLRQVHSETGCTALQLALMQTLHSTLCLAADVCLIQYWGRRAGPAGQACEGGQPAR